MCKSIFVDEYIYSCMNVYIDWFIRTLNSNSIRSFDLIMIRIIIVMVIIMLGFIMQVPYQMN